MIRIVKYNYAKPNTFQMVDEYGDITWIEFQQMKTIQSENKGYQYSFDQFESIEIVEGY